MAKSTLQRRYLGIIAGTSIMAITALTIFSYLPHDTTIVFPKTSNILQHSSESLDKTSSVTYTEQNTTILVALWIALMVIGSYLLFHIHFKVLPKERK